MYNSNAQRPPAICAKIYGKRSSDGNFPAATIITETAGLKFPPEYRPTVRIATAKAIPMGKAEPVAKITYRKNNVPKNSAINLFIIYYVSR